MSQQNKSLVVLNQVQTAMKSLKEIPRGNNKNPDIDKHVGKAMAHLSKAMTAANNDVSLG